MDMDGEEMNDATQLSNDIREPLVELRRRLASLYGDSLVDLVLYGSRARGNADADAGIDVLIVLRGQFDSGTEVRRTAALLSEISLQFDVVIKCVFVDEARYISGKGPIIGNIFSGGIRI
jgi:predicted nucleotidyltransferase